MGTQRSAGYEELFLVNGVTLASLRIDDSGAVLRNANDYNPVQSRSSARKVARSQEDDHWPVMVDQIIQTRQVSVLEPESMIPQLLYTLNGPFGKRPRSSVVRQAAATSASSTS